NNASTGGRVQIGDGTSNASITTYNSGAGGYVIIAGNNTGTASTLGVTGALEGVLFSKGVVDTNGGNITIRGLGANTGSAAHGISLNDSSLLAGNGAILLTGNGGGAAGGSDSWGLRISNSSL